MASNIRGTAKMAKIHVSTTINGSATEYLCDPNQTLLDVLRDTLGLTGSKEGCGSGDCGACSVMINGRLVCSCLVLAPEAEGVKIQKLGDQRWLLVPQAPAVVWPKVKQFFADNGVAIELEQPQTGRIDTEWMTISSKAARDVVRLSISDARQSAGVTTGRDRVRVLIEPGIRDRSTEIHLRYENDSKSMPHEDVMPAQSDIVEVETQLLNELGGYIAANVADASISFVARNISTQSKAELQRDASDLPTLRLNLDFDRAWATVNQALHEANLDVTDVDRSAGVFYVTVTDQMLNQEEKPSIWTRWFRSEHKRNVTILMEPKPPGFDLTVFDDNGQRTAADVAEQILIMIREFAT